MFSSLIGEPEDPRPRAVKLEKELLRPRTDSKGCECDLPTVGADSLIRCMGADCCRKEAWRMTCKTITADHTGLHTPAGQLTSFTVQIERLHMRIY